MQSIHHTTNRLALELASSFRVASEPEIPDPLIFLIADYVTPDYELALSDFELDETAKVINTLRNHAIKAAIKETLSSAFADPKIKGQIFLKFTRQPLSREFLRKIINEIRKDGGRLNLDDTDLSDCMLINFDLSDMTAIGATFSYTDFFGAKLLRADCSNATFKFAILNDADMTGATLNNASLVMPRLINTTMINVKAIGAKFAGAYFHLTNITGMVADDIDLNNFIARATKGKYLETWYYGIILGGCLTNNPTYLPEWMKDRYETYVRGFNSVNPRPKS